MMTREEFAAKQQILNILNKQGYPTYSRLLDLFDINLTDDPNVVAYMEPGRARIVINRGLDIQQVSTVVRHEILHEYLEHAARIEKHLTKDVWDKRTPSMHQTFNRAADYEISNRGYTDADKDITRNIKVNGISLKGLVTEDDFPDWTEKTAEEMYDELSKQLEKEKQEMQKQLQELNDLLNDPDFIAGWNKAVDDYEAGILKI